MPAATPDAGGLATFMPLATERLTLRLLCADDADALHRLINDWEITRTLAAVPFPYDRALADGWIVSTHQQAATGTAYHLAITGRDGVVETLVGGVGLRIDPKRRAGRLGYWVGRRFWGHGVATEAAGRLARWALANLDLDLLEANVDAENPASAAVLRRIGFRNAGEGREAFPARGGDRRVHRFHANRDDLFGIAEAPSVAATPAPSDLIGADLTGADLIGTGLIGADLTGAALAAAVPAALPGKPLLLVAACALVDADGRVLLSRRPEGKPMAGLWEFPGGKLNPGETPEAALIRELNEELGLDVSAACLAPFAFASHAYARFHLLMPLYVCRRWKGMARPREGQTLAWVRPERLSNYAMPPADAPLVPLLRELL